MNVPTDEEILGRVDALLAHAYSPYSNVAVGAVVVADDGTMFEGVNVENASLGLTICAERNALFHAVAKGAAGPSSAGAILLLAFSSNNDAVTVPCGACRQVIAELAPRARIIFGRKRRVITEWRDVSELLPRAFDGTWKKDIPF